MVLCAHRTTKVSLHDKIVMKCTWYAYSFLLQFFLPPCLLRGRLPLRLRYAQQRSWEELFFIYVRNFRQSTKICFNLSKVRNLLSSPCSTEAYASRPPPPPTLFWPRGEPPHTPSLSLRRLVWRNQFSVLSGACGRDAKTPTGVTSGLSCICPAGVSLAVALQASSPGHVFYSASLWDLPTEGG